MTQNDSIAVLADIHGNAFALQAVLNDAQRLGINRFVNLGDTFYGPLDPERTWQILKDIHILTILGNQDRILLEGGSAWESVPAWRNAVDALGPKGLTWLARLPKTSILDDEIFLCHGTPDDDMAYLMEDVSSGRPVMQECSSIQHSLADIPDEISLVLTGHSHFPGSIECAGRLVVNPGSVGLPAYDDDSPPHVMASGSPQAKYCVITRSDTGWDVDFRSIEYDWDSAAELATTNGREDWAQWLRTGQG